ncbi:PREDICTED: LOC18776630 [Prunus dulcis]|uniref:PREDICTED: LOC18776630 n=2 Tax=Prunus dulcis TaxID=3755 RepID=A0A5E4GA75_PRUDU|nr:uncharacterized protein LOC117628695 [Prunus dulcis]VVA36679.1 PREDICTED: LOC18776630 [Prunus dulcis]
MLSSFLSFFNRIKTVDAMLELEKPNVKNFIYRDELSKKPFSKKQKMNGSTCFESSEPLIKRELEDGKLYGGRSSYGSAAEEKGEVIRVKIKMTKQEAAQMLSKCKNGGVLEFKDVTCALAQIPTSRVRIDPSPATNCGAGPAVLKTISEEY